MTFQNVASELFIVYNREEEEEVEEGGHIRRKRWVKYGHQKDPRETKSSAVS